MKREDNSLGIIAGTTMAVIAVFTVIIILVTFGGSSKSKLIGKWQYSEGWLRIEGNADDIDIPCRIGLEKYINKNSPATIEFRKNGTYFYNGSLIVSETYSLHDKDVMVLSFQGVNTTVVFTIDGNELTMTNGSDTAIFQKAG